MNKIKFFVLCLAVLSVLVLAGCYQQQTTYIPAPATPAQTAPVIVSDNAGQQNSEQQNTAAKEVTASIENFAFVPATVTINAGDTVTWTNIDSAQHNVAADNSAFVSNTLSKGDDYSFTFNSKGTYSYHCTIHPSMQGTIIVE